MAKHTFNTAGTPRNFLASPANSYLLARCLLVVKWLIQITLTITITQKSVINYNYKYNNLDMHVCMYVHTHTNALHTCSHIHSSLRLQ